MAKREANKAEKAVADRILEMLDRGDLPPWVRPWRISRNGEPQNAISGHVYRGINRWMTGITREISGYAENRWLTQRQAELAGGRVLTDEEPTPIIFWKFVASKTKDDEEEDAKGQRRGYPMARLYRLYNMAQTEGCEIPDIEGNDEERAPLDPIAEAEAIITAMPNPPAVSYYRQGNTPPHYLPATDQVRVPERDRFETAELFYNTMFHELAHATGHPKRLARLKPGERPDLHEYGAEELVAGMGAAMLADAAGLSHATIETDAAYVKHWRDTIRGDKRIVAMAGQRAEKAYQYVRGYGAPQQRPGQQATPR